MGWKTIDSRVVFENNWMRVHQDRVTNPRGGQNDYGHVRFKSRAVAIVPLDDNENTWLVGQHRYTLDAWSWEVPMGGAPLDEPVLEAAKRELKEETGLSANHWTEILRVHTSNSITDELGVAFVATELQEGDTDFDETEELTIRKMPLQDAVDMAISGDITDAISVAALLHIALVRKASSP